MAAPFVTGAIALAWSEFPAATAAQIRLAVAQAHGLRRATVVPPLLNAWAIYQAMAAGKMNVDVECSPLLGPQLMSAVKDVVAGKPLPKRILTEETVFPMSVAAQTLPTRKY